MNKNILFSEKLWKQPAQILLLPSNDEWKIKSFKGELFPNIPFLLCQINLCDINL